MSSPSGRGSWTGTLAATAAVSLGLHAGGLALASRLEPRPPGKAGPVEVAFEAVPPSEPPRAEPPPPPPPPEPAAPRRVAMAKLPPPPRDAKPPPPPPPNEPPPPDAAPAKAVPKVAGLSLSSTVQGGGFSVPVGNTQYAKAAEVATDPRTVKPYSAEGTAPPPAARLSSQPRLLEKPEAPPYPAEAKRAGVEGQVKVLLRIDRQGRVVSARVLSDPGAGLGEAARADALRLRFTPGMLDGEPVEVPDFLYTYTFVLE